MNIWRSVIIAELWRPKITRPGNFVSKFCGFFGKTISYVKIFKIMLRKFFTLHRSTLLCSNFVKFCRREIGEIVRYLLDQKTQNFGCLSNSRYCTDRAQDLSGPASTMCSLHSAPDFIHIGSLSAEL